MIDQKPRKYKDLLSILECGTFEHLMEVDQYLYKNEHFYDSEELGNLLSIIARKRIAKAGKKRLQVFAQNFGGKGFTLN